VEHEPEDIWQGAITTLRQALEKTGGSPADVAGADTGAEAGDCDSTVAETWPRIEGIDREQSERRLCGNRELFGTLLHSLVQQYADFEEAPIQVIAAPDIARRIHKLKGSAGTLGAMRLHDLALRTESALQRHDDQLAGALLSEVGAQLSRLRHDCASTFEGWQ
jgi:HPt (histidine-containing phosphotransfer) domain-containing protein